MTNVYPFEKFERKIPELNQQVKQRGLLIVNFTQYSLWDTTAASNYEALGDCNQDDYVLSVFDKNSNLIKNPSHYDFSIDRNSVWNV